MLSPAERDQEVPLSRSAGSNIAEVTIVRTTSTETISDELQDTQVKNAA
jgi:hypothetical protein